VRCRFYRDAGFQHIAIDVHRLNKTRGRAVKKAVVSAMDRQKCLHAGAKPFIISAGLVQERRQFGKFVDFNGFQEDRNLPVRLARHLSDSELLFFARNVNCLAMREGPPKSATKMSTIVGNLHFHVLTLLHDGRVHLSAEPRLGVDPVSLGGSGRNLERLSRLVYSQASEIPQFDELANRWLRFRELVKRLMECRQLVIF
jgi:hypothetical protein